jgi:hypothetical protein
LCVEKVIAEVEIYILDHWHPRLEFDILIVDPNYPG